MIRILIVDDHPLVRVGITTVVNQQADMRVVGEADSAIKALALFSEQQPDLVLMDLRLGADNGAQVASAILDASPAARVLVISNYEGDENIHQALAAGAQGYLFKSIIEDELIDAIREVHAGRKYLPTGVTARLEEKKAGAELTPREEEILDLLGKGLGNRELGQVLGVTGDTIKTHLKSLFRKLEVSNRAEAVREGLRRGFIVAE